MSSITWFVLAKGVIKETFISFVLCLNLPSNEAPDPLQYVFQDTDFDYLQHNIIINNIKFNNYLITYVIDHIVLKRLILELQFRKKYIMQKQLSYK